MAQHENDPLFEPPLTGAPHDDDAHAARIGGQDPAADASPPTEPSAAPAHRRLLRTVGVPVALAAAGLLAGATLTGVAMAAGNGGTDGARSSVSQDRGPVVTIPDEDDAAADGTGTGFTLPAPPGQDGSGRHGDRGGPDGGRAADAAAAAGAPAGHTSTGASA